MHHVQGIVYGIQALPVRHSRATGGELYGERRDECGLASWRPGELATRWDGAWGAVSRARGGKQIWMGGSRLVWSGLGEAAATAGATRV